MKAPAEELLRVSRLIGADERLVVWGGGNSSVKALGRDYRGRRLRVLHVKGSGSDMRTLASSNLTPLDLEALLELRRLKALSDGDMVAYLQKATLDPKAPRGSIETLLHAFLPPAFILHTHADATAALVDNPSARKHVEKCWGGRVALVPYQRPGFGLSVAAAKAYEKEMGLSRGRPVAGPQLRGVMLDKHGLITWGDTADEAYKATVALVGMANRYVRGKRRGRVVREVIAGPARRPVEEIGRTRPLHALLPILRGVLSRGERQILCVDKSPAAVAFSLRKDAAKLCGGGPATPDHLLYTKPRALYVSDPGKIAQAVAGFRKWYDVYFKKYAAKGLIKLDSAPRVVVIKGYGVVTAGKDARTAIIGRDIFRHSAWVRQAAAGLGGYRPIGIAQVCDFEYWPLENYKLSLAPPEKELSRQIAMVTGGARGIGKACAAKLYAAGACVAVLDLDLKAARAVAAEFGERGLALKADISDESQVEKAFAQLAERWGGLDLLVSNAGLARCAPVVDSSVKDWDLSFGVNARGHYLCSRAAARIFKAQGTGGNMVFVSSKNVLAPGKDFAAYSASKAAQTQLARVLALELADSQVRVNCVTPDGVFEDSRLWDAIRDARSKAHGIQPGRLKDFYVNRNLLKREVRPSDVAEAVLFLASDRSSRTTGSLFPVDGGVKEAFPR